MRAVRVAGLTYQYPDGTPALRDVRCEIGEGERVGVIGPNGAGKSSLLLHLNGLLPDAPVSSSAVHIFETPAVPPHLSSIRKQVGLLFQDADDQLFCPTVREDVAFGPRQLGLGSSAVEERVARALKQVGLDGYEGRSPHRLSGGEKRRACLAGVLACEPRVLALDEPTSGLDPRGRRELLALLEELPMTQVVAGHDLAFIAQLCPRVILLDAGAVVAQGPSRELLSDADLMFAHGLECVPAFPAAERR